MARPEGFEPPTTWFEARYSIQLSYGRSADLKPSSVSLSGHDPDAAAHARTVAGPGTAVQIFRLPLDTQRGPDWVATHARPLRNAPVHERLHRPAPRHSPIQPESRANSGPTRRARSRRLRSPAIDPRAGGAA